MRVRAGLPTGVTALLFDEARERRQLERRLCERLEGEGFCEVLMPILDYAEPYESLVQTERREQMYRFVDRDGQLLALRADFTPMLARLLAPRIDQFELPLKVFYRGDVVRHQEARPGRLREHSELGAELLAPASRQADERMLRLFMDLIADEIGRLTRGQPEPERRVEVVVGFAGAFDHLLLRRGVEPEAAQELMLALSRRDREVARQDGDVLHDVLEHGYPNDPAALGEQAAQTIDWLLECCSEWNAALGERNVRVTLDLAEFAVHTVDSRLHWDGRARGSRRDWSYYDGVTFRAYLPGNAQPVGNGGRYDWLFQTLGASTGAVGFTLGLDRLIGQARPEGLARRAPAEGAAR